MAEIIRHEPGWSPEERAFRDAWLDASTYRRSHFVETVLEEQEFNLTMRQMRARIDHWLSRDYKERLPMYAASIAVRTLKTVDHLHPIHEAERFYHIDRQIEERLRSNAGDVAVRRARMRDAS